MRALVVNCSKDFYNLGARKLESFLKEEGYETTYWDGDPGFFSLGYDLVALSVIFSWDTVVAKEIGLRVKEESEVWVGGPGITLLGKWYKEQTGIEVSVGLDKRFDKQLGDYQMVFASRGCPVGCYFCLVPILEGTTQILDWDFKPAPILADNNLSALPVEFQEHIIKRYLDTGTRLEDANSGFEPAYFDEGTYERWLPIMKHHSPWRIGYDVYEEGEAVHRVLDILKDVSGNKKRIYVLAGNEPFAKCLERAQNTIKWRGEPYIQPVMPLNALSKDDLKIGFDWSFKALKDFQNYFNSFRWRAIPIEEFRDREGKLVFGEYF